LPKLVESERKHENTNRNKYNEEGDLGVAQVKFEVENG
jgi:hypothetical protein